MLYEWAFFALEKYTGLQALQSVPNVFWDVNTIGSTILTDDTGLQYLAVIIVGRNPDFSLKDYKRLSLVGMMMHGDECARLQAIEETVAFLIKTLMEVVVHPQPW
jgi:hypothetical protein